MSLRSGLRLLTAHLVVALVALVVIGGATRVMEAGLACPDWPLCYGVLLPGRQMNLQVFLEWFHRLDAFLVGVALVLLLALSSWRRQFLPPWLPWLSALAVGLVLTQGLLGALTVTGLLASSTVTAHLATALLMVVLISGIDQCLSPAEGGTESPPGWWCVLPPIALALVFGQCVLGAAMASRWAVDHCFSSGSGCEWLLRHRQIALPAGFSVLLLAGTALSVRLDSRFRALSLFAAALVALQVALGILTLRWQLQIPALTIGHQFVAALLMAVLGAITGRTLRILHARPMASPLEVSCG